MATTIPPARVRHPASSPTRLWEPPLAARARDCRIAAHAADMWHSLLVFAALSACAAAVVAAPPQAPLLPLQWSHGGQQTLAAPLPPWRAAPLPRVTTAMQSWYDYTDPANPRMRETYQDMCVPIFPKVRFGRSGAPPRGPRVVASLMFPLALAHAHAPLQHPGLHVEL